MRSIKITSRGLILIISGLLLHASCDELNQQTEDAGGIKNVVRDGEKLAADISA